MLGQRRFEPNLVEDKYMQGFQPQDIMSEKNLLSTFEAIKADKSILKDGKQVLEIFGKAMRTLNVLTTILNV